MGSPYLPPTVPISIPGPSGSVSVNPYPMYKEPLSYYINLFTSQYKQYTGTAGSLLTWAQGAWQPYDDLTTCLQNLAQALSLNQAVGVQLDLIGQILNMPRTVPFQPSGGVSPVLTDAVYQLLLKATIGKYHWDGKTVSLYAIWKNLFPGGSIIIEDNQNMTATVVLTGSFSSILVDLITNGYIVPRPEGVLYTYVYGTLPLFGCDLNNTYVAGVDLGHIA